MEINVKKKQSRVGEKTQQLRAQAALLEDQGSIPPNLRIFYKKGQSIKMFAPVCPVIPT